MSATPTFFQKGLAYLGAAVIGTFLTVTGLLTTGSLSVTGASTLATATITTATITNASVTNATSTALAIGTGKQLTTLNSAVASLDFPAILGGQCVGRTMTVTGASTTSPSGVAVGVPAAVVSSATATNWYGYASSADTVTVVGCNNSSTQQPDLAAANFRATVSAFAP